MNATNTFQAIGDNAGGVFNTIIALGLNMLSNTTLVTAFVLMGLTLWVIRSVRHKVGI